RCLWRLAEAFHAVERIRQDHCRRRDARSQGVSDAGNGDSGAVSAKGIGKRRVGHAATRQNRRSKQVMLQAIWFSRLSLLQPLARARGSVIVAALAAVSVLPAFSQAPAPAKEPSIPIVVRDIKPGSMPSWKDLKFPPLGKVKIPKPEIFTMSNGMKVYLLENHELPLVSGRVVVRTGNLFDPKDKRGLAEVTGMVMRSGGTSKLTGDQLDEKLENMAASVESSILESSGSAGFSCLKDNTTTVLGLFHDVVTDPAFREAKLDLAKTQIKSAISRRNDDASGIAQRELYRIIYGPDTPYGGEEEYDTINAIKRDDVVAFYKRYFF